jgi:hypothetical protein
MDTAMGVVCLVALLCLTVLILSVYRDHISADLKCLGLALTLRIKGRRRRSKASDKCRTRITT